MRRNSLAITVGTDSLSSNDDLSMIKELACLHKHFPEVSMGELFTWACLNGARFLSKESVLGSLEPGKCPGIVLVKGLDDQGNIIEKSVSERLM